MAKTQDTLRAIVRLVGEVDISRTEADELHGKADLCVRRRSEGWTVLKIRGMPITFSVCGHCGKPGGNSTVKRFDVHRRFHSACLVKANDLAMAQLGRRKPKQRNESK